MLKQVSVQMDSTIFIQKDSSFSEPVDGLWVEPVFLLQYLCCQGVGGVIRADRYTGL